MPSEMVTTDGAIVLLNPALLEHTVARIVTAWERARVR